MVLSFPIMFYSFHNVVGLMPLAHAVRNTCKSGTALSYAIRRHVVITSTSVGLTYIHTCRPDRDVVRSRFWGLQSYHFNG